jgi:hypothetical protein
VAVSLIAVLIRLVEFGTWLKQATSPRRDPGLASRTLDVISSIVGDRGNWLVKQVAN